MVAVARRALGERRIGHCGTLDPMATGVLALAVGQATRLVQFLSSEEKHYEAVVAFGRDTNTYDATGDTVAESSDRPSREALVSALAQFRGTFAQLPPAYSAKKIGGVRAYRLARREDGAAIDLKPSTVTASHLELVAFDGDRATFEMRVSAGFYVRALAHDLGRALGMGATLEALRRTRAGAFGLEDAVTIDTVATSRAADLAGRMIPMSRLLPQLPSLALTPAQVVCARRGMDVPLPAAWSGAPDLSRLLDEGGDLLALATPARRSGFLHPSVVLG
jgi:tRNA pseudouridine55 synthase